MTNQNNLSKEQWNSWQWKKFVTVDAKSCRDYKRRNSGWEPDTHQNTSFYSLSHSIMTKVDDTPSTIYRSEEQAREVPPPPYMPQEPPKGPPATPNASISNTAPLEALGDEPGQIVCPECGYVGSSEVKHKVGGATVLSIAGLFFLGCTVFGCCLLPLCIPGLKDAEHRCPRCRNELATYSRLERRTMTGRRH